MADCTVTLDVNTAAISGGVMFEALPNQIVGGNAIDTSLITARATTNAYEALLQQGAEYRVISDRFPFSNSVFRCPASSTADLMDLLEGF